jgi:hypothetical protein
VRRASCRARGWLAGLLAVLLLTTGCGLALPGGVQTPGAVPEEQSRDGEIAVVPPGPTDGATPRDIVTDFLGAQSSPEGRHLVAREFLTPEASRDWRDDAGVRVYDAASPPDVEQLSADVVQVRAKAVAIVDSDGSYRRSTGEIDDTYRVRCTGRTCRISSLKDGLRLNQGDFVRSFAARPVYFLAPSLGPTEQGRHLAADLVWLPRTDDPQRLVQAVLDGPSVALRGSVTSAVPFGTRLLHPVTATPDGVVTVDLSRQVRALPDDARQQLSAQLVWTLRSLRTAFTSLRLLVEGGPFEVGGSSGLQDGRAYASFDPERLEPGVPGMYLDGRRLHDLVDFSPALGAAGSGQPPADDAAVSPDGELAVLTTLRDGRSELRTGPQAGPFGPVRASGRLSSPTWGSGEQGLFLLRGESVVRLPPTGDPVEVPVDGSTEPVRRIEVARDGVRVALLTGDPAAPSLMVGRIEQGASGPRIVATREIAPTLSEVVDVTWETDVSLVVLASFQLGRLPARVAADGFTSSPPVLASRLPLGLTATAVAAAAGRPVVLAGVLTGGRDQGERLYRDDGSQFVAEADGHRPFYPG